MKGGPWTTPVTFSNNRDFKIIMPKMSIPMS